MTQLSQKVISQLPRIEFVSMGAVGVRVQKGSTVALYNTASTTVYAAISKVDETAPAAPATAGTNIIPLKPLDWTLYVLRADEDKISTAATVAIYKSEH